MPAYAHDHSWLQLIIILRYQLLVYGYTMTRQDILDLVSTDSLHGCHQEIDQNLRFLYRKFNIFCRCISLV